MSLEKIRETFIKVKKEKRDAAFIPYFMYGFPTIKKSEDIIYRVTDSADLIEIGIPFSDPMADGSTIQAAGQTALKNGVTLRKVLKFVKTLHTKKDKVPPILLMSYINPVLAFGIERLASESKKSGVSGFIIPDLLPEESGDFCKICDRYDIGTVFFLAPNSNKNRMETVINKTTAFIYFVSYTGVTGKTINKKIDISPVVREIKRKTNKPVCVGFGIRSRTDFKKIGKFADGAIIGSEILRLITKYKKIEQIIDEIDKIWRS